MRPTIVIPGWGDAPAWNAGTAFGDLGFGLGAFATGMGEFLRNAAEAEAAHANTWVALNEYVYLCSVNAGMRH